MGAYPSSPVFSALPSRLKFSSHFIVAALVVLAVVAEVASTKYEDDYKGDSYGKSTSSYDSYKEDEYDHDYKMKKHVAYARTYKHEPEYYEEEYHEPRRGGVRRMLDSVRCP